MNYTIAIIGSRTVEDPAIIRNCIGSTEGITKILTSNQVGCDTLAKEFAKGNNIPCEILEPEWEKYGKSARGVRNENIIKQANFVYIFWDCESQGTKRDIKLCYKLFKDNQVIFT